MDARYQQIARQLKAAITSGELKTGSRLPSSRTWAQENGISRTTVEQAYGELVAQGWLERRGQAGTFVSQTSPSALAETPAVQHGDEHEPKPFQMGLPALDLFPRALWARLTGRRLRTQSRFDLTLGDPAGEAMLRQAIADYLRFSRSIECQPEQIFITSGYAQSMSLILQTLARPGDGMWVEDPGFPLISSAIEGEGVQRLPVPVDQNGMDIEAAIARWPQARFALLTPAHQSPLGVALSLPRRRQVLAWAAQQAAWIIEDDYDSEFRYHGRPLPPLKSLDAPQRVIYTGTFSKSLFPAIRTAWIVVPAAEAAAFRQRITSTPCSVPTLWQCALADFIQQGHFWRHLKKMRLHYAQRRAWLEAALIHYGFNVVPQQGGIQLVAEIDGDDRAIVARAQQRGLAVQALSDWHSAQPGRRGILMSFTNITSAEMAMQWVGRLYENEKKPREG
ncbi:MULTISPECIES: PLP-dependent aminotransferase family protein [Enterobacteriaceae]|jgi:GntR family transcriptional regulator/MocR family aminotransferase|uniref:MocR-like pyridoxine biosynthesis transcription factor PdxR n=1 Tax=Enterobacteriaceae TaxID=543 RepID=UPI000E950CC9|nr:MULTISPECIES: PLP-dependent aminotransferase family protein [Enterobacteriaceae]MDF2779438.1 DNA-binding transcriptional regulator [Enterobacteriaceae bacterium]HAZ77809.1 DNA-binding transcriptional regulator [Enterobacteriaceae bacterium]